MTRAAWRPLLRSLAGAALAVTAASCRRDTAVPVEELFTTRTLAMSFLQRGQLPEAEAQFTKLIELAPDDPLGYANLGLTYLQEGRYPEAEERLRKAHTLDPANADVVLMLAKVHLLTGRQSEARAELDGLHRSDPRDARALHALAVLDSNSTDPAGMRRYEDRLTELLVLVPANVAVRLELLGLFMRRGEADSALRQVEEVRRIPPEPPADARPHLEELIQRLRRGQLADAGVALERLVHVMQVTAPYQAALDAVRWAEGPIVGTPLLTYAPADLVSRRGVRQAAVTDSVRFVDVSDEVGLLDATRPASSASAMGSPSRSAAAVAIAVGDVRGDGRDALFLSSSVPGSRTSLAPLLGARGTAVADITARAGVSLPGGATFATFADVDNDGFLDLFAIGADGRGHLLHNRGDGTFQDVTAKAGIGDVRSARKALFVDLDHDGDLDLLLLGPTQRTVYRNNLDGTFTEATAAFGLAGGGGYDAAFGDLDGDGRVDLVISGATPRGDLVIFHNGGAQRFSDVTAASGLASQGRAGAIALGDYDGDGHLDIFVARLDGGEPALWHNTGNGTFSRDTRAADVLRSLRGVDGLAAEFVDYDNDGRLDLLVVGTPAQPGGRGVFLLHNDGNGHFSDRSTLLPASVRAGTALAVTDVDQDGDEDLLIADAGGAIHLLRNDGGNRNMGVSVQLKALRTGSGKNNDFGIGSRLELRAGSLYQTRVVTSRVTHFGLGPHLKADVLRVEWTNGVPQTVYFPGTDRDVVESETLKGSCAFAYTWDGTGFRFVTDVMWRSALGMPLGLMAGGASAAFAPAGASQEYLRIPGTALRPRDGRYLLQLTEELWETAYADEVRLLAVDHPDSVDVFVDERFVPPGPVALRLFQATHPHPPLSAVDERGNDVLPALRASDDVYVSNLTPSRYQGVVEPHDLVMDLGEDAGRPNSYLFLRGWIYPTDASINVALSQQTARTVSPPSLEVRDAHGRWRTAIPSLGFPSGKNKTMVIDLAGRFPTSDHHVRIRTSMQIYWDQAFVASDVPPSPVRVTTLSPVRADLHARGFSRMFRKGGRYGPYWFAYDDVTTASPWRPIEGSFTRFGDVLPLLQHADDEYVIMGPGDEATLEFDASSARGIRPGWTRDFLLYTDGWIKDSDLNTAFGTTVEPLPFHGISSYPYAPGESYPADAEHQRYRREYNTRAVRR